MRTNKRKKGISLIVLIITIIVMIILAAAIILSLNNSGIIGKANKAKTDSDAANLKEYVNVLMAEWELDNETLKETYSSFSEYATAKLQEARFDTADMYVDNSGKVYTGSAAEFMKKGVKIGDTITGYTLSTKAIPETDYTQASTRATTVTTKGLENTWEEPREETDPQPSGDITRDNDITWTYIGLDEDGNALIAGSVTSSSPAITVGGVGGYINGPATLDAICRVLYSNDIGTARNMNIDDVIRVLEYTGETSGYYDTSGNWFSTGNKPLKIGDLDSIRDGLVDKFHDISRRVISEEILDNVSLDYFLLDKDSGNFRSDRADLIFLPISYLLSSNCCEVDLDYWGVAVAHLGLRRVYQTNIANTSDLLFVYEDTTTESNSYSRMPQTSC